jgi:hypothetical protein
MSKKVVPLRPARKEGSKDTPKPLTLADLTISHAVRGSKMVTLTGQQVAAILEGTQHIHEVTEPSTFVDPYAMHFELIGMAATLEALGGETDAEPFDGALNYLAGQLKQMAHRVCALAPDSRRAGETFTVEVKR